VSTEDAKACDGCARAARGSSARTDASSAWPASRLRGEEAGVDREAIEMLRWLTEIAKQEKH